MRLKPHYGDGMPVDDQVPESADVTVIGAGIGGLCAAALLARGGFRVHVFEQSDRIGGYFGAVSDGVRVIDLAVSYVLSCGETGEFYKFLEELGIRDQIEFKRLERMDSFRFPDGSWFSVPADVDRFEAELAALFPAETQAIAKYFAWMKEFDSGLMSTEKKGAMAHLPPRIVLANFLKDYQPFLESHFVDPKLRSLLAVRTHADPSSLMIMAGFLNECFLRGMYYPLGGSHRLPLALARFVQGRGGSISLNTPVTAVAPAPTGGYRITCQDGRSMISRGVVSNISPFNLMDILAAGKEPGIAAAIPAWREKSARRAIGHSSFNIYLVVRDLDLGRFDCGRVYLMPDQVLEEGMFGLYRRIERGDLVLDTILKVHCPSVHDASLAPAGESIIRIETDMLPDAFSDYRAAVLAGGEPEGYAELRDRVAGHFIERVERLLIPGLGAATVQRHIVTPLDWECLTLNHRGSGTGWAHTVDNYIKSAFPTKSPFPGIHTVGQWGELGTGLRQGVMSARRAVTELEKSLR